MTVSQKQINSLCLIGIGNTLAGDDGAGVVALERLRALYKDSSRLFPVSFAILSGDLYSVTDFITSSRRIIFLDALAGTPPGALTVINNMKPSGTTASLHQLDICSVMQQLAHLELCSPFPLWEIRGITIVPPNRLSADLSPAVNRAVNRLVKILLKEIDAGMLF